MIQPKEITPLNEHLDALLKCRNGKPTEGVLLRFNEKEFYLLNLAARLASHKGYSSRQAWMREIMMSAIQNEIEDSKEFSKLTDSINK